MAAPWPAVRTRSFRSALHQPCSRTGRSAWCLLTAVSRSPRAIPSHRPRDRFGRTSCAQAPVGHHRQLRRRLRMPCSWSGECRLPRHLRQPPHRYRGSRRKTSGHGGDGRFARHARSGRAEGESGEREPQSGDLAPRLRFAIGHFHMFPTIGIGLMRRIAAKVEIVLARLAERPLACPIRRRSMIEQTCDTKSVPLFLAHSSTPDDTKRRSARAMVRRSALRDFRDILSGDSCNIAVIARKSSLGQKLFVVSAILRLAPNLRSGQEEPVFGTAQPVSQTMRGVNNSKQGREKAPR